MAYLTILFSHGHQAACSRAHVAPGDVREWGQRWGAHHASPEMHDQLKAQDA
jgi:hypothetical protein